MAWVKKRGHANATSSSVPGLPTVPMYNPNEHSNQENQWQPQLTQTHDNWYGQPQHENIPPPQTDYSHPHYIEQSQQHYAQNTQQYPYQEHTQTEYYQNNPQQYQQSYGNLQYNQQYNSLNNLYPPQQPSQPTQQTDGDAWNWGWGDEDNSNVQNALPPSTQQSQQPPQTTNNLVAESFTDDKAWNWSLEESNLSSLTKQPQTTERSSSVPAHEHFQTEPESNSDNRKPPNSLIIDHITGKRGKLETPQWSVESQMSQESSDDVLQTSESDKSHIISRSSTVSQSPIAPDAILLPHLEEIKKEVSPPLTTHHEFENKEIVISQIKQEVVQESVDLKPSPPQTSSISPSSSIADIKNNPSYKPPTGLSHKTSSKFRPPVPTLPETRPQQFQTTFHTPPTNLETLPDNSEQPDSLPQSSSLVRKYSSNSITTTPTTENNEAPINDRNQYLETGQLSDVDTNSFNQNAEGGAQDNDTLPPPGLRRMVLGQDKELGNIVNSVRNMTVSDSGHQEESRARRQSKEESSESDQEIRSKSPRDRRDHRYKDNQRDRDRERARGRYSPDYAYRDKKHSRGRYKDRRYEEDTDYYSDKEKEHRHKDERSYDRKYNSLRKEKDRRRRDDNRDYRDVRKGEYYYDRYEDGFENESRSRASSRSDSLHDSYRERDRLPEKDRRERRHKEKDKHRRPRGMYNNPYAQGFGYDIYSQYYQQYQFYENLRKNDPQAYAQLYRKYYQDASMETPSYGREERASVHSGRSSANDELAKDRYMRQSYYSQTSLPQLGGYYRDSQTHSLPGHYGLDDSSFPLNYDQTDNSLNYDETNISSQRLTPVKFATAHIKASINCGKLVKILPHYPLDGQTATVELSNLEALLFNDEEFQELKQFPGPLIKGVTHKKTIIEYCEKKIREAPYNLDIVDPASYILMWELLILLIRQNGMVVGTDIAELLLKNQDQDTIPRSQSVLSSISSNVAEGVSETSNQPGDSAASSTNLKEFEITNKFREYLLYGSGKEALEWAMKHGLWGHALFLASKLDKRTYANVLMRFANGLSMNDPLQTLYQLLSGKVPAAVTCVVDEKWGDWRPHLAMILSNSTQRPELNLKAITTLGDTLLGRGSLYAAQFCYLMAEVGFGSYENPLSKLVLLGSDHKKPFLHFATNDAIHMTEIYEYACSLNDANFTLGEFQYYKYLLSTRLADRGLLEKALAYLEQIANAVVKNPTNVKISLINDVINLADRLKFYDPVGDVDDDTGFGANLDTSRPDNSWLKDLREVQNTVANNVPINHQDSQSYTQDPMVWSQQTQYDSYQQSQWSNEPLGETIQQPALDPQPQDAYATSPYQQDPQDLQQQQQQYWPGQQQSWNSDQTPVFNQEIGEQTQQTDYYGSIAQDKPSEVEKAPEDIQQQPQISMPNQSKGKNVFDDEPLPQSTTNREKVPKSKSENTTPKPSGNGWFGGIFSKLSFKPNNQMKLPDDKNPSIVWDPEKKRWINTEEENGDGVSEFKPPPKMSDIMPKKPQLQPMGHTQLPQTYAPAVPTNQNLRQPEVSAEINGKPPIVPQPNMFKLQKHRTLKKSYIDVFNPNGKSDGSQTLPAPVSLPNVTAPNQFQQMNFFIPQPVNDPNAPTDFLTPAPPLHYDPNSQSQAE